MYKIKLFLAIVLLPAVMFSQETSRDKSMTSLAENSISVTLGGAFIVNGSFPASPFERVDQFVTRIYNGYKSQILGSVKDKNELEEMQAKLQNFAQRDIVLKRINDKDVFIDLEKFRVSGDFKLNPYLKNDDVLIFPQLDLARNFISIDGAVNRPIKFQFVVGDRLSDALLFAGGLNKAYENVNEVEINRLSYDGSEDQSIKVKVKDDIELKVGDRIRVLADETNRKEFKVLVIGEVNRPGYIPITKNSTTIYDVVEKIGGFKENADLNRTELIKVNDPHRLFEYKLLTKGFKQDQFNDDKYIKELYNIFDNKNMENMLMQRVANVSLEDSLGFRLDNALRLWRQESLVDFTKVKDKDSNDSKYLVEDGDIIIVPSKTNQVYVFGQVASTGYQKFEAGKEASYYIDKAGGTTIIAKDIEESIIIKGKSRNWMMITNKDAKVEAGDFIWVPKKQIKDFKYYMDLVAPVASVISSIVTVAILIVQLNK